jgi:hypothetical protein
MYTEKIPFEIAIEEVNAWLDYCKVAPSTRIEREGAIKKIAEGIQYGYISIGENGAITQTLVEPILDSKGNVILSELKYKARLTNEEEERATQGRKPTDSQTRTILGYVYAATGVNTSITMKMAKGFDNDLTLSIGFFFT